MAEAGFLVMSLILNSMEKEISDAFVYAPCAQELREEVERRFGASVKPQIFHLHGELQTTTQGNDSVVVYFTKLKRIWNELEALHHENLESNSVIVTIMIAFNNFCMASMNLMNQSRIK